MKLPLPLKLNIAISIALLTTGFLGIGFIAATSFTGCVSVGGTNQLDVARMAHIAGAAAHLGSAAYLSKNPEARPYFVSAFNALGALDHSANYDPAAFAEALKLLPIRELSGPNGNLYVLAAIIVWDELAQRSINVDRTTWVKPTLIAVRLGIGRALGIAPGTKAKGLIP